MTKLVHRHTTNSLTISQYTKQFLSKKDCHDEKEGREKSQNVYQTLRRNKENTESKIEPGLCEDKIKQQENTGVRGKITSLTQSFSRLPKELTPKEMQALENEKAVQEDNEKKAVAELNRLIEMEMANTGRYCSENAQYLAEKLNKIIRKPSCDETKISERQLLEDRLAEQIKNGHIDAKELNMFVAPGAKMPPAAAKNNANVVKIKRKKRHVKRKRKKIKRNPKYASHTVKKPITYKRSFSKAYTQKMQEILNVKNEQAKRLINIEELYSTLLIHEKDLINELNSLRVSEKRWRLIRRIANKLDYHITFISNRDKEGRYRLIENRDRPRRNHLYESEEFILTFGVWGKFFIEDGYIGFRVEIGDIPQYLLKKEIGQSPKIRIRKYFHMLKKVFVSAYFLRKAARKQTKKEASTAAKTVDKQTFKQFFYKILNGLVASRLRAFKNTKLYVTKNFDVSGLEHALMLSICLPKCAGTIRLINYR